MRKGGQYRADDDGNIVKVEPAAAADPAPAEDDAVLRAPSDLGSPDRVDGPATSRGRQSKKG